MECCLFNTNAREDAVGVALPIIFLSLALGILLRFSLSKIPKRLWWIPRFPYTVTLFILGVLLALIEERVGKEKLGLLGESIHSAREVAPMAVLFILLPPLLFESGFLTPHNWNFATSLVIGSILSATDPVAVVAALQDLGAPKRLSIMIEGESLLNDGSAYVLFLIVMDIASGSPKSIGEMIGFSLQLAIGGPVLGVVCAFLTSQFIKRVFNDPLLEAGSLLLSVYTTYFIGEKVFHTSSVLAVVSFGLYIARRGKYDLTPEVEPHHHAVLSQIAYYANTSIFIIAGIVAFDNIAAVWSLVNWLTLMWVYVGLHIIRPVGIAVFWPVMGRMGYGFDWKDLTMLTVSALRGGMALILALFVEHGNGLPAETRNLIAFHVSGIVLLTILINGSITESIYKLLRIDVPNPYYPQLIAKALVHLEEETTKVYNELKADWFYKHADWRVVQSVVPNLSTVRINGYRIVFDAPVQSAVYPETQKRKIGGEANDLSMLQSCSLDETRVTVHHDQEQPEQQQVEQTQEQDQDLRQAWRKRNSLVRPMLSNVSEVCLVSTSAATSTQTRSWKASQAGLAFMASSSTTTTPEDIALAFQSTFLNAVKANYHRQFEDGYLTSTSLSVLQEAADIAMESSLKNASTTEHSYDIIAIEYQEIRKFLPPTTIKSQSRRYSKVPILSTLLLWSARDKLSTAVEILSGFIHAHLEIVDRMSHEIRSSNSWVLSDNVDACIEKAREELVKYTCEFPGLMKKVQTIHVVRFLVETKRKVSEELYEEGLLDAKAAGQVRAYLEKKLSYLRRFKPDL
ncbi:hypothetical protein HK102_010890 [Quaeritorhiza haematococci]|nr:hypothetical protein HK102_010890 [Quaeritorhiza haematococci]